MRNAATERSYRYGQSLCSLAEAAQTCYGKFAPLVRMKPDDFLICYSPKTDMTNDEPLQSFTAIGRVVGLAPYLFKKVVEIVREIPSFED